VIAFLQAHGLDQDGGQADGEAVAPFGDFHGRLRIYFFDVYIFCESHATCRPKEGPVAHPVDLASCGG
jgi:hypothetical protein